MAITLVSLGIGWSRWQRIARKTVALVTTASAIKRQQRERYALLRFVRTPFSILSSLFRRLYGAVAQSRDLTNSFATRTNAEKKDNQKKKSRDGIVIPGKKRKEKNKAKSKKYEHPCLCSRSRTPSTNLVYVMYAFPSDIGDICQSILVQNGQASHVREYVHRVSSN